MAEGRLHPRPHRRRVLRDRGRPRARQEVQARHRGGGRPHRRPRRHRDRASPTASRPRSSSPMASPTSTPPTRRRTRPAPSAPASPRRWRRPPSARCSPTHAPDGRIIFSEKFACPVSRLHHRRDRAAAVLASTRRRAPARPATASARSWCSTRTSSSPTTRSSIKKGAVVPWAKSNPPSPLLHAGARLASPAPTTSSSTRRGATCPRRRSDVILHGTGGRAGHPALHRRPQAATRCKKPFEGVIGNLNRRMLQTESAWMREELVTLPGAPPVRGLPRRPPQARGAGGQDRRRGHLHVHPPLASPTPAPGSPTLAREAHPDPERDRHAPSSRRSTSASASSTMSGSTISTSTAPAARSSGGESQRIRLA